MTKTYMLVLGAMVLLASASGAAVWLLRDRLMDVPTVPKTETPSGDYDAFVKMLNVDEALVRNELNDLVATASVRLSATDEAKRNRLTNECLDARVLLELDHVRNFVAAASRGERKPYHFVAENRQEWLKELVGDEASPAHILAIRKALAGLSAEFQRLRQPPEWNINIEPQGNAAPPDMPYLDLLRSATKFRPLSEHPTLASDPKIPTFSGADGELLAQLEHFFNTAASRRVFPPEKFTNLYYQGRIVPIPVLLVEHRSAIVGGMNAERKILLPGDDPAPAAVQAVDDVYAHLERFFLAVEQFAPKK